MFRFNLLFGLSLLGDHIAASSDGPDCKFPINWDNPACMYKRIVGGENAPADKYPWFSRHIFRDTGKWAGCGGMLVAPEYVLTAAHCVWPNYSWSVNNASVQIGAVCSPYTSNNNCNQPVQEIDVDSITPHPNFSSSNFNNDYALVKLAFRANATPVKMDDGQYVDNYSSDKRNLYAIGFGATSQGGPVTSRLKHVELAFVPRSTCNSNYSGGITANMMCAADPGQDACQGDSGGPLYDNDNDALVGVVSWGNGCAQARFPGVYSQVSTQWTWIKAEICNGHSNPKPIFCSSAPTPSAPTPSAPTPSAPTPTPAECDDDKKLFSMSLQTDDYGNETKFFVKKKKNGKFRKTVFSGDNFNNVAYYYVTKCLSKNGCYKLVVKDSEGDGICCDWGIGSFQGYWNDKRVPNKDDVFDSGKKSQSEAFGKCNGR